MSAKRRRITTKSLTDTVTNNRRTAIKAKNEALELQTWSDLPADLLQSIFSRLILADNVRASAVCKSWQSSASAVRVVNQSPWLMRFPKNGEWYEFYDPVQRKTYSWEFAELTGAILCCAKDGWLLLYRPRSHQISFFNPFTREVIKLPAFEMTYQVVAFSCAPTSPGCVVFTAKHMTHRLVSISTCHPGASKWTTVNYRNHLPFACSCWIKVVVCNGLFYCLSFTGELAMFDPVKRVWNVRAVPLPKSSDSDNVAKNWWKGKFLAEHEGGVLLMYKGSRGEPIIYKLDEIKKKWKKMYKLGGVTVFASFLSTISMTNISGLRTNSVYFSKVRFFGKCCISYNLGHRRYYPSKQCHDWGEGELFETLWIEPPKNFSALPDES